MSWKWEELTALEFARAMDTVERTCLVPLGVLEKHGEHLPLGMDVLAATRIAELAVELEHAILFPTFYYGQIHEAKQYPGTIAIRHDLMAALLENLCEEIARNGFTKIILFNGHGGNESFLSQFVFRMLETPREFTLYVITLGDYLRPVLSSDKWKAQMVSEFDEHGGEAETSLMLVINPALVKMDQLSPAGTPQKRLAHLPCRTPVWWYADFPTHYAGDAKHATTKKGTYLLNAYTQRVAEIIKAVKTDTEAPRLQAEYFARICHE